MYLDKLLTNTPQKYLVEMFSNSKMNYIFVRFDAATSMLPIKNYSSVETADDPRPPTPSGKT